MKKYLVYKIVNKINNNIYVGIHTTENINDSYMGSGTNIKKAIKQFGMENFEKIILYQFDNEKDMLDKEKELVNKEFIKRPDTYNISIGGGTFLTIDTIPVRDEDGNYFRVHKEDPRYLSGELKYMFYNKIVVKDKNETVFLVNNNDPRYLSGELVGVTKGLITVKDKDGNTSMVSLKDPRYLSGELVLFFTGKKHTSKTKERIGKANAIHQLGKGNSQWGTMWITNGKENKKIKKDESIPSDWYKGRKIIINK